MGDTLRTFLISMLVSGIVLFAFGEYMLRRVEGFDPLPTFGTNDESVVAAAPVPPERQAWETIPAPKLVGLDLARAKAQWKDQIGRAHV